MFPISLCEEDIGLHIRLIRGGSACRQLGKIAGLMRLVFILVGEKGFPYDVP